VASSHAACVLLMPGTSHAFESLTSFPVTSRIRHIKSCDDSYEPLEISSDRRACEQSFRRLVSARSLPPLPSGETLVVGLGSLTDCSTGGWVWSAAAVLCEYLKEHEAEVQSSAVLELGCGTGACGMYAAALGARRVTLTDGGSNALLALARANVRANCLSGHWAASGTKMNWAPSNTKVEVVAYRWGESAEEDPRMRGNDWVIGSELINASEAHAPLCASLAAQLQTLSPHARILLSHQHSSGMDGAEMSTDEHLQSFTAAAHACGLAVRSLCTRSVDQGGRRVSLLRVERR